MANDKSVVLKNISNIILGHTAYNTVFESIKYENTIPEYNPVFSYEWELIENGNVITVKNTVPIDCAGVIDRSSSLMFDIEFLYYIENDELSQIQINISNIKPNYGAKSILINDFINNIVQYLITGSYSIFDGRDYIAMGGNEEKTKIILNPNAKVSIGFKSENNAKLSIRSLFINDLTVVYNITEKQTLIDSVKSYSATLGNDVQFIIEHNNTETADIYKLAEGAEPVDMDLLLKDYKKTGVNNCKDYLYNVTLNKIVRTQYATVADILSLADGVDIELNSINYIVSF